MPALAAHTDAVFVGRIREDNSLEHGLNLWIVADNVRKGAALNAVQIAERLSPTTSCACHEPLARSWCRSSAGRRSSTPERRQQVVEHVRRARADGYRVAIVVSAMGRRGDPYATDTLLDLLRSDGGPVTPATTI